MKLYSSAVIVQLDGKTTFQIYRDHKYRPVVKGDLVEVGTQLCIVTKLTKKRMKLRKVKAYE